MDTGLNLVYSKFTLVDRNKEAWATCSTPVSSCLSDPFQAPNVTTPRPDTSFGSRPSASESALLQGPSKERPESTKAISSVDTAFDPEVKVNKQYAVPRNAVEAFLWTETQRALAANAVKCAGVEDFSSKVDSSS